MDKIQEGQRNHHFGICLLRSYSNLKINKSWGWWYIKRWVSLEFKQPVSKGQCLFKQSRELGMHPRGGDGGRIYRTTLAVLELTRLGWPRTHRALPVSASPVLWLKACVTMPGQFHIFTTPMNVALQKTAGGLLLLALCSFGQNI